jgi:hypothetical protein
MQLFIPSGDYVGSWLFADDEILIPHTSNLYYSDFYDDLFLLLTILEKHQLLIPKFIGMEQENPIEIVASNAKDIVEEIKQYGNIGELNLYGDTIIFTECGTKKYHRIFTLDSMRFHDKNFTLNTKSDIWLPMAFDIDSYTYFWNLEHYRLNHYRLEAVLSEISETFKWKDDSHKERDHNRGCIQLGYKIFLSDTVMKCCFEDNPNGEFNLEEYLSEIVKRNENLM